MFIMDYVFYSLYGGACDGPLLGAEIKERTRSRPNLYLVQHFNNLDFNRSASNVHCPCPITHNYDLILLYQ